ncbi:MAG: hypothetical protein HYU39_02155 [Thaumarchaeota archaeon]|nr:hypothetical protein [Nitrososphaerota archaeon]
MFVLNGREERVISLLKSLDLTEYQAKAYFTMLMLGKSRATVLSKRSGVPSGKAYSALYQLSSKKLARAHDTRPREFEANGIDCLVQAFVRAKRHEVYKAVRNGEELKRTVVSLKDAVTNPLAIQLKVFQPRLRRVGVRLPPSM